MLSDYDRRVLHQLELDLARDAAQRWPRRAARAARLPLAVAAVIAASGTADTSALPRTAALTLLALTALTLGWQLRRICLPDRLRTQFAHLRGPSRRRRPRSSPR